MDWEWEWAKPEVVELAPTGAGAKRVASSAAEGRVAAAVPLESKPVSSVVP